MSKTSLKTTRPHLQFKKIAVLTDFSKNAHAALRFSAAIAKRYEAGILLAHAYIPLACAFSAPDAALVLKALDDERQSLKTQLLDKAGADFLRGIQCTILLIEGTPQDMLGRLREADLIVVGTSGETGLAKAALGSTAETIFRSSSIPVLTIGPACSRSRTEEADVHTVLYATDFSAGAALALPYALSIAKEYGAKLVLLHVARDKDAEFSFDRAMASEEPLEALHGLVPDSAGFTSQPLCVVGFGRPHIVILEKARDLQASVIVIGVRGADGFASVVSHSGGGTAYRVAADAECPVLTIPRT